MKFERRWKILDVSAEVWLGLMVTLAEGRGSEISIAGLPLDSKLPSMPRGEFRLEVQWPHPLC